MADYDHPNDQMPGGADPEASAMKPLDAQLLLAARAVERWWLDGGKTLLDGAPACIFQLRQALEAWGDVPTPSELAVLYAEPQFWTPIQYAPEGRPLLVGWLEPEDTDNPERHQFDVLEDGVWQVHDDDYQHFLAVAPPGSIGPSEKAPYTHFLNLKPLPRPKADVVDAEFSEVGEAAVPLSKRVWFDDQRDVVVVNHVAIAGALLEAFTKPTPQGEWFRVIRAQDGQSTIERRTDDQLHQLTSALEVRRALKIADDVAALPIGGKQAASPTAFQAGYQTACEEITERLRTEVHQLPDGIRLPACGPLPSLRQPAADPVAPAASAADDGVNSTDEQAAYDRREDVLAKIRFGGLSKAEQHALLKALLATAPAPAAGLPEHETPEMHDAVMAVLSTGVARTNTDALWQAYRGALPAAQDVQADMVQLFREALAWGMVYGPEIPAAQWDRLRDDMADQFASRTQPATPAQDAAERALPADHFADFNKMVGAPVDAAATVPADVLAAAAALLRWHLDGADVHPCDQGDDDVRAKACIAEVQALHGALKATTPPAAPQPKVPVDVQDGDSWEANVAHLLSNCPYTVRQRPGGGPEDLKSSLVVTFRGMQMRLQGDPMFSTSAVTTAAKDKP